METFELLVERQKKQKIALRTTEAKMEGIVNKDILPKIKLKHEGKYYKYLNSYGGDAEKWWLYYRVDKVNDIHTWSGASFQDDKRGKLEFTIEKRGYISSLKQRVSKSEYDKEFKKFLKKMQSL
jgi:hypothetical protein